MEMTVNATQRGEWVVDGDVITTTVTEATDPSYSMAIDGVAFEFPGGAIPFEPPEVELNSGSAVCTGDTLALTVDGFVSHWMRTG